MTFLLIVDVASESKGETTDRYVVKFIVCLMKTTDETGGR